MTLKAIAVDDEPLSLELIEDYCKRIPSINLISVFDNSFEALDYLKSNKIDLIFLDIQMNELTGIQLLNVLKDKPLVIFITAYDKYAIQGYELDIVDYILKPISLDRFIKAVDKAIDKFNSNNAKITHNQTDESKHKSNEEYIFVKTEFKLQKIDLSDILYIEGMGDYLGITTTKQKIMTLQNFKKIEELLPNNRFCRVHKSFIVSIEKIESIERNRIIIADKNIPISEMYKKSFFHLIDNIKLD
jgi:two-component system LytT family response regulator